MRKNAAIGGEPNASPRIFRKPKPTTTAGMVASTTRAENAAVGLGARRISADERAQERHPVAPEIEEQRDRGAQMHHDEIGQEVRIVDEIAPAHEPGKDHGVAEARNREEFGDALQEGHHDGLEGGQVAALGSAKKFGARKRPASSSLVRDSRLVSRPRGRTCARRRACSAARRSRRRRPPPGRRRRNSACR